MTLREARQRRETFRKRCDARAFRSGLDVHQGDYSALTRAASSGVGGAAISSRVVRRNPLRSGHCRVQGNSCPYRTLGEDPTGLSANVVSRLKVHWADEHASWSRRDLSKSRYVYWWVDDIHTGLRSDNSDGQCLLVIIGVRPDGRKESVVRTTRQFSITLPNEMAERIRAKVASGEYASESEVIRDRLRTLAARDRAIEAWLRDEVVPAAGNPHCRSSV